MTIYVVIPDSGGEALGIPALLTVAFGAIFGGHYYLTNSGDVVGAAGAAAGLAFALLSVAGDHIANLAPASQFLFAVGWFVRWILGLYFAFSQVSVHLLVQGLFGWYPTS